MIPGTAHSPSIEHVDSCCADSNVPLSICRLAAPKTATSTMGTPTSSTIVLPQIPQEATVAPSRTAPCIGPIYEGTNDAARFRRR
jgi:hypothetical protein